MTDREKIVKYIDDNRDELVRIASGLISIPTISGRPDSNEQFEKIADYLTDEFAKFGVKAVKYADDKGGGCNLVATLDGKGEGRTLAMGGHYDVVAADEDTWTTEGGFVPTVRDGKLIGRGSADMKGGLACCFMAIKALKECDADFKGKVQFIATVDEEITSTHGMTYLHNHVNPDFFINAEQTEMKITVAYKGCAWMECKVKGVTAHGSKPELGVNAIVNAAKLIYMINERGIPFEKDDILGNGSLNVGVIKGGEAINIVPDECTFRIDGRLVPGITYDEVIGAIRGMIAELKEKDPTFDAEIDFCDRTSNAIHVSEDNALVKGLLENSEYVSGKAAELGGSIAQGDNYYFIQKGKPSLMYGPGTLDCIHKADEWVSIDELVEAAKIYALTAISAC